MVALWRVRREFGQYGLQRELSPIAGYRFDSTKRTGESADRQIIYAAGVIRCLRILERIVLRWHGTCLFRALAARRVLWDSGIEARLMIGTVEPASGVDDFHAHAWIEVCGSAIGEGEKLSKYTPMDQHSNG